MKKFSKDDFVIDAVEYQGRTRYSLQSKYQTYDKEEILDMIDALLKSQKIGDIKEQLEHIDIDELEKKISDVAFEAQQAIGTIKDIKKRIESVKI